MSDTAGISSPGDVISGDTSVAAALDNAATPAALTSDASGGFWSGFGMNPGFSGDPGFNLPFGSPGGASVDPFTAPGGPLMSDPTNFFDERFSPPSQNAPDGAPAITPGTPSGWGPLGGLFSTPAEAANVFAPDERILPAAPAESAPPMTAAQALAAANTAGEFDTAMTPASAANLTNIATGTSPVTSPTSDMGGLPAWAGTVEGLTTAPTPTGTATALGLTGPLGATNPTAGVGDLAGQPPTNMATMTPEARINNMANAGGFPAGSFPDQTGLMPSATPGEAAAPPAAPQPSNAPAGSPGPATTDTTPTPTVSPGGAPSPGPGSPGISAPVSSALSGAGSIPSDLPADGAGTGITIPGGGGGSAAPAMLPTAASLTAPIPADGSPPSSPPFVPPAVPFNIFSGNINAEEGLYGIGPSADGATLALPGDVAGPIATPAAAGNINPESGLFAALNNAVDTAPPAGNINPEEGIEVS